MTNEEKWLQNYEALKAYIEEHHHLPPKDAPFGAKYLLNWMKYQRKRMKAGLMSEEQKMLLDTLLGSRSNEHNGGRKKEYTKMPQFIFDPYRPKEKAYATEIKCNYPGCTCRAINSHVMQRSRYVKSIAEDGLVLQMTDEHLQPLLDGDENGNPFKLLSTKQAMSLPIYCEDRQHDQKLFKTIEQKEMDLDSFDTFLRLSYRAYCAARAQEQRRSIQYEINPTINTFCQGDLFDMQKDYSHKVVDAMAAGIAQCYTCMKEKRYDDYTFKRFTTPTRIPVCLSDCIFVEKELIEAVGSKSPLSPLFVHVLPYPDRTEVLIGYEVSHKIDFIESVLREWETTDNYLKSMLHLMAYANNWCASPSFFGTTIEDRNAVCEFIFEDKIDFQMEGIYYKSQESQKSPLSDED